MSKPRTSHSDQEVAAIRQMLVEGQPLTTIAAKFGVTCRYVYCLQHNLFRSGIGPDASQIKLRRKPRSDKGKEHRHEQ